MSMAKMSKTQRIAVLDFHNGVTDKRHTMLVRSVRTLDAMVANGWAMRVTEHTGNVTTAGLIEAGVDMGAIETEAHKENNRREADDRAGILARHAAEVRDLDHAEVLRVQHDRQRDEAFAAVRVGRNHTRELAHEDGLRANRLPEVSGRWAGATDAERVGLVEAAHAEARTEDSQRRVAAARQGQPEALNGTLGGPEMILAMLPLAIEQAHDEALHHVRKNCPAPLGMCERCTAPAAVRAARGDDSAYHCGRPWVAEIQKCPRCGLTADKHPTAAHPPVAEPTHTFKRGLRSA